MLTGKKIILGVCGSIAAYKAVYLLRLLVKEGAEVKVIMTESATKFVSPLTFSTLSGERVMLQLFENDHWENHALLGRWADLLVVAPATADTIAHMAHGGCDNLLLAVYLSATCPVMIAPAMDEDMWQHPAVRKNLSTLSSHGVTVLNVEHGDLASGLQGAGRLLEPEVILNHIREHLQANSVFAGKRVLITAGPTVEPIDPVRFLSNHSTGKMGIALAEAFSHSGAEVVLVLGPTTERIPSSVQVIRVQTAAQMFAQTMEAFKASDIIIMSAAVADYTPVQTAAQKIKKGDAVWHIELTRTQDILAEAGRRKQPGQTLVGFALETDNEREHAKQKLISKNADFIILNSLNDPGAAFGSDNNQVTIFGKDGSETAYSLRSKDSLAWDIVMFLSKSS